MTAIFDLDGTLVDSSKVLSNSINHVREHLKLPPLESKDIIEQINNPNCNYAEFFYETDKIDPIFEELFKNYYAANHDKELEIFDGIEHMLKELKANKIKLALATNGYRDSTLNALKHLRLSSYFDTVVTFDDVQNPKPSPDMLYSAMYELNSHKTIFIGDSDRDLLAAKAANLEFILVDFVNKKSNANSLTTTIKNYLV